MQNKKKKIIILSISILAILFLLCGSYAWFSYIKESSSQQLIAGDIYLHLDEGNDEIALTNVFPETKEEARSHDGNTISFSINGKNTSNKTVYYDIVLNYGEEKESPKFRYHDLDLKFDLVETNVNGDEIDYLLNAVSYDDLDGKRIYVDTIDPNTNNEIVKYYKIRMWLDENVIISDTDINASYTATDYKNAYATIKVTVSGDFMEKEAIKPAYRLIQELSSSKSYIKSYDDIIQENPTFTTQDTVGENLNKKTVYYYTGNDAATNANVLFAGFCWQIIRTTDNGGVRILYNGVAVNNKCETTRTATKGINGQNGTTQSMSAAQLFGRSYDYDLERGVFTIEDSIGLPTAWTTNDANSNGTADYKELIGTYTCLSNSTTCTTIYYVGSINQSNTGEAYVAKYTIGDVAHYSQIGTSPFNVNGKSLSTAGYMFNKEYSYKSGRKEGEYFTTATWNGTAYILSSGNNGVEPNATHHYICDSDCTKVRYYYYVDFDNYGVNYSETFYKYILLENGKTIEDALKEMINYKTNVNESDENVNVYNSVIKAYLDNWYKSNYIPSEYTSLIDQTTVYCGNRSIYNLGGWKANGGAMNGPLRFMRYVTDKDLSCANETDRFSVSNNKAKLINPVGLLTQSEFNLMTADYAKTTQTYWTMSPNSYNDTSENNYCVSNINSIYTDVQVKDSYGVRPVVTLNSSALIESGMGTYTDPYIVGPIM